MICKWFGTKCLVYRNQMGNVEKKCRNNQKSISYWAKNGFLRQKFGRSTTQIEYMSVQERIHLKILNEVYRIDVFFFEYDRSCAWIFSVCGIRSGKCVVTLRCVFHRAGSTSGQSIQLSIRKFECDFNGHSTFAIPNAQVPFTFLIPFSKCSMSIVNVCARAMLVMCCYFFALHTPIYFLLVVH